MSGCSNDGPQGRVIILGIDGLDPALLDRFVDEGACPNFKEFIGRGDYRRLQTTMPPLSPVAWSTFITGMDPGGHRVFDFIHREADSMMPEMSMSRVEGAENNLEIGSWVLPLGSGSVELLRKGEAFWQILEANGVPTTIYKIPANFPPAESPGKALSGMGTPDLLGTPGTFSFYTDDPVWTLAEPSGGQVFAVEVLDDKVSARLKGPANSFRLEYDEKRRKNQSPDLWVDFEAHLDYRQKGAKFEVQGREFVLMEGEWSDWVRVDFTAVPYVASMSGICRFYLQEMSPDFRLYVSPLQINPEDPALPISTPESWAAELQKDLGYFYTQELPEDTKALSAGIFNGREFWEQSQFVYREQRRALDQLLSNYRDGLLFFYFSSVDQGSHMLWQFMDEKHPLYREDPVLKNAIRTIYSEMDEALGRVLQEVDDQTTLIVMSDHGFSPFYRQVNLNSWLLEKGYVKLKDPALQGTAPLFMNVDWSATTAYALGLNGIYVNLAGREPNGVVSPGPEREELLDRLEKDLYEMVDPKSGEKAVTLAVRTSRDFHGPYVDSAPDLIVGYNWGYRTSWESPLGEFPHEIFTDNLDPWSGDHCVDYRLVPGVLISNRKITMENPSLADLTVAVLDEYGIDKLPEMLGRDCLGE